MVEEQKKKILLVDDDKDLCNVVMDKFTSEGFEVACAYDGEEGVRKAIDMHPDLILLDIIMPKMDGWQMLDELHKDPWGKKAKVMILTNVDNAENVSKALLGGNYEYLVKTDWSLNDLVERVRKALGVE